MGPLESARRGRVLSLPLGIVVRSLNRWLTGKHGLQRCALTVGIEVERSLRLYGELRLAL